MKTDILKKLIKEAVKEAIHEELKDIIEDQLVRADLIVISGESKDESFELITRVLQELGDIKAVAPAMADSGRMNYGTIGPDKTPVITLPGDPVATALAAEIFVRPMIRTMLGSPSVFRRKMAAKLNGEITSSIGAMYCCIHQTMRWYFSKTDTGRLSVL